MSVAYVGGRKGVRTRRRTKFGLFAGGVGLASVRWGRKVERQRGDEDGQVDGFGAEAGGGNAEVPGGDFICGRHLGW